jgi:hypothetical protein
MKGRNLYLFSLFQRATNSNQLFIEDIKSWLIENPINRLTFKALHVRSTIDSLNIIGTKLDQQDFYNSYKYFVNDLKILESFEKIDSLISLRTQIDNEIKLCSDSNTRLGTKVNDETAMIFNFMRHNDFFEEFIDDNVILAIKNFDDLEKFYSQLAKDVKVKSDEMKIPSQGFLDEFFAKILTIQKDFFP